MRVRRAECCGDHHVPVTVFSVCRNLSFSHFGLEPGILPAQLRGVFPMLGSVVAHRR